VACFDQVAVPIPTITILALPVQRAAIPTSLPRCVMSHLMTSISAIQHWAVATGPWWLADWF